MSFMDNLKGKINEMLDEKRELKAIKKNARKEAMKELEPELKAQYKEKELAKMKKKNVPFLDKMGKLFEDDGKGPFSRNNIDRVLNQNFGDGNNKSNNNNVNTKENDMFSEDKIGRMLGKESKSNKKDNNDDDKLKRMLE
jgi:hypothetical protein